MELFDLVDKQDTVVGVTNKKKAHATGELHRVDWQFVPNDEVEEIIQWLWKISRISWCQTAKNSQEVL